MSEFDKLIACKSCQKEIAVLAAACPSCGAPNGWRHPLIEAMEKNKDKIQTSAPFHFDWDKTSVWGSTIPTPRWWGWLGCIALIVLGTVTFLFVAWWVALVFGALAGVVLQLSKRVTTFKADLRAQTWASDDDKFWQPVKAQLLL